MATREELKQRRDAMREYKAQGHTMSEVAQTFGVSKGYTKQVCKGIAPQKSKPNPHNRGILQEEKRVADIVRERLNNLEYYGNYTGTDGTVDLRCTICGVIITRSWVSVRHGKCRCDNCYQTRLESKTKSQQIKKDRQKRASAARKDNAAKQLRISICEQCGEPFIKPKNRGKYCSEACKRKAESQARKHAPSYNRGSDDRLNKTNIIDRDITLERLFDRDNGRCQICGEACDWNDHIVRDNGVFVAGESYPSIDHIIPISLGGKHSWVNVRLAHRGCNTKLYFLSQRYAPSISAEGE